MLLMYRIARFDVMNMTSAMLTIRSTVIARAGTWKRLSTPSCLIVIPAREIPNSARPASAVEEVIDSSRLAMMQIVKKLAAPWPTIWVMAAV